MWHDKCAKKIEESLFRPYQIKKRFEGHDFKFEIKDLCAKEWYDDDRTSTPETSFIKQNLLKPGDIAVDCGAHHGILTIIAAMKIGENGKVFSFEALPRNASAIIKNVTLNKLNNVEVNNVAVGAYNRTVQFIDDSNGYVSNKNSVLNSIDVEMIRLDDFFEGQKSPDFIKIDVEGYEINVLKGARRIMSSLPSIAVEFHTSTYDDPLLGLTTFYELMNVDRYIMHIQLEIDGPVSEFKPDFHTNDLLVKHQNIHFFGLPRI